MAAVNGNSVDLEFLVVLIPITLSGGAGTRLWPISRESHQFKKHAPD